MSTPSAALGNRTPEQLKVAELREELRKRGIQIKGLKKDLVDRLEDVLRQEELEEQKTSDAVETEAPGSPVNDLQPEPVTPITKKRSKGHHHHDAKEEQKDIVVSELDNAGTVVESASAGTEETVGLPSQPPAEESTVEPSADAEIKAQDGDTVSESVADEKVAQEPEAAAENATTQAVETSNAPLEGKPLISAVTAPEDFVTLPAPAGEEEIVPELEVAEAEDELAKVLTAVDNEETTVDEPAFAEASLKDSNVSNVTQEEPQVQNAREEEAETVDKQTQPEKSTDVVLALESGVDDVMGGTEDIITTTFEKTVTTLEEQVVAVMSEDQKVTTAEEEQVCTTSTTVATMEESATTVTTTEETTTTVETMEKITTILADGEGAKLDTEDVRMLEDKSDYTIGEALMEDASIVADEVTVAEKPKEADEGAVAEKSKDETMDDDADAQKGSKRKETVDGENILEPTKRRRWNSAKGEGDSRGVVKEFQPLELQEALPSPNASAPSLTGLTPKSIPSEKVAVTRTAPTRAEATVNGEIQKTRVVPPSVKPGTTSLKIDKFLRPFTFKAVKELLAQTGTVEDVWMDQIKTHCYVTYSSVEEATATRNALYNLQWPPQGGRLLTAEFVEPSEVKLRSDGEKAAAAPASTPTTSPSMSAITPRGSISASTKSSTERLIVPSSSHPSSHAAASLPPPPPLPLPPRDRLKQEVERTPTLDDLFRKTRSKPHIYYLPLTAEEVAERVAARNREAATKPGVKA